MDPAATPANFDIVIIGAGSGNMTADKRFADKSIAIVEEDKFGGTCLNRGCIPSKMYAYTAEVAETVLSATNFDIPLNSPPRPDWAAVRDRIFDALDTDARDARKGREETPNITVFTGTAEFTGPKSLTVSLADGSTTDISGHLVVVAAGSRPVVPDALSGNDIQCHTSDTIMRMDSAPGRLAILGGGYIGVEFAHILSAFGTDVTIIDPEDTLLSGHDETITEAFTNSARSRYTVITGRSVVDAERREDGVTLSLDDGGTIVVDEVLIATGRTPNTDRLRCDSAGIELGNKGHILVDSAQRTTVDGILALGDICDSVPLKHVANREAQVVAHNLLEPDNVRHVDTDLVPSAVFGAPQVASIGRTEQQLRDDDVTYVAAVKNYSDVAYGWAMQDETGLCKILAEPGSGRILGAHVMGPQAATLIHIVSVAMQFGIGARDLAERPYWAHPALPELLENTLLALELG